MGFSILCNGYPDCVFRGAYEYNIVILVFAQCKCQARIHVYIRSKNTTRCDLQIQITVAACSIQQLRKSILKSLLKEAKGTTQYPTISCCFGSNKTWYLTLKTLLSCLSEKTPWKVDSESLLSSATNLKRCDRSFFYFQQSIVTKLIEILQWDQLHLKIWYSYFHSWFFQIFNYTISILN